VRLVRSGHDLEKEQRGPNEEKGKYGFTSTKTAADETLHEIKPGDRLNTMIEGIKGTAMPASQKKQRVF
jgi:hypothetical protein